MSNEFEFVDGELKIEISHLIGLAKLWDELVTKVNPTQDQSLSILADLARAYLWGQGRDSPSLEAYAIGMISFEVIRHVAATDDYRVLRRLAMPAPFHADG